jgi:serine/threonine protein phosphatase 1
LKWLKRKTVCPPSVPRGYRVYAIGDVHGRRDLLDQLLALIEADLDRDPPEQAVMVFLGDLIDRGNDSHGVVERLRNYQPSGARTVFLLGNHEEVLLRLLAGERAILESWLKFGGAECLMSYGVDAATLNPGNEREALRMVRKAIPESHRAFLRSFADTLRIGDYLFVHAGIRPKIEIDRQTQRDLRWIRRDFLDDEGDHGLVVVHGHTIEPEVQIRPNRIGIDTGAYRSGCLTSLVLEGCERRIIDTGEHFSSKTVD